MACVPMIKGIDVFMGLFLYLFQIRLIYNEDDKVLESPRILLHIRPPVKVLASTTFPPDRNAIEPVKQKAQEVLSSIDETVVCEPWLLEAIESRAEIDLSQFDHSRPP